VRAAVGPNGWHATPVEGHTEKAAPLIMVLVDTSIWINHLRKPMPELVQLLELEEVLTHPCVIGELACGTLANRRALLYNLSHLPHVPAATDAEVLEFIERRGLMGAGVGYLDMHLLTSTCLALDVRLWTRDKKLAALADQLAVTH
jgi:predicted nucleic acid-binding protein